MKIWIYKHLAESKLVDYLSIMYGDKLGINELVNTLEIIKR